MELIPPPQCTNQTTTTTISGREMGFSVLDAETMRRRFQERSDISLGRLETDDHVWVEGSLKGDFIVFMTKSTMSSKQNSSMPSWKESDRDVDAHQRDNGSTAVMEESAYRSFPIGLLEGPELDEDELITIALYSKWRYSLVQISDMSVWSRSKLNLLGR